MIALKAEIYSLLCSDTQMYLLNVLCFTDYGFYPPIV